MMASAPPAPDQAPSPAMASPPPALDPVPAMAIPPPAPDLAPPAAEEEDEELQEERPYAMYRVFGGMGPAGTVFLAAYVGIHALFYVVKTLSFSAVLERKRFWSPIQTVVASTCIAATALVIAICIRKSKQQQPAAAVAELLPPPPPEMDMC